MERRGATSRRSAPPEHPDPWEAAIRCLTRRAHTTHEMRLLLARRGYRADQIASVVTRLKGFRYLDDLEFARTWVRARTERRGLGPARLVQELRGKGVAEPEISQAVDEVFAERGAREVAEAAAARKLKTLRGLSAGIGRRRLAAHLGRQGFAPEVIQALCRNHFPGADESDDG